MSVREWRFLNDEVQGLLGSGLVGICRLRGGVTKDDIAMDRKILEKYSGFGVKFAVAVEIHEVTPLVEEERAANAAPPVQPERQDPVVADLGALSRSVHELPPVEPPPETAAETTEPPSGQPVEFMAPEIRFIQGENSEAASGSGRYMLWAGVAAAAALVAFGAWKMTSSGPSEPASVSRERVVTPSPAPSPVIPAVPETTGPAPVIATAPKAGSPTRTAARKQSPTAAPATAKKPAATSTPNDRPAVAAAREMTPAVQPANATPAAAPPAPVAASPVAPAPKPDRRGDALRALTGGDSRREDAIRALGAESAADKARRESALKALGQR